MKTENTSDFTIDREDDLYYLDKEQRTLNGCRKGMFIMFAGMILMTVGILGLIYLILKFVF